MMSPTGEPNLLIGATCRSPSARGPGAVHLEHLVRVLRAPRHGPRHYLRSDGVKLVFEARHDPEIAASTPQAPEEVVVLPGARPHKPPVCRDDVHREHIIATPAEPAREVAKAPPEREPGNARGRKEAEDCGQAVELGLAVQVT